MEFNYLDLFFAIPLIWGIVRGLMNGLIRSLSVFVGLILGIYLAHIYAPDLSPTISDWFTISAKQCLSLSYVIIFIAVMVIVAIIARILDKFIHLILLGWLNKLLGALFGVFLFSRCDFGKGDRWYIAFLFLCTLVLSYTWFPVIFRAGALFLGLLLCFLMAFCFCLLWGFLGYRSLMMAFGMSLYSVWLIYILYYTFSLFLLNG